MADGDKDPCVVRHADLSLDCEIAALVGAPPALARRENSAAPVSVAFAQRFAFAADRA